MSRCHGRRHNLDFVVDFRSRLSSRPMTLLIRSSYTDRALRGACSARTKMYNAWWCMSSFDGFDAARRCRRAPSRDFETWNPARCVQPSFSSTGRSIISRCFHSMITPDRGRVPTGVCEEGLCDLGEHNRRWRLIVGVAVVGDIRSLCVGGITIRSAKGRYGRISSDLRTDRMGDGCHDAFDGAADAGLLSSRRGILMGCYSKRSKMFVDRQ